MYLNEIKSGTASKENKEPDIVKESAGTALVEGNNLIGKTWIRQLNYNYVINCVTLGTTLKDQCRI